jgi:hypothetical protein
MCKLLILTKHDSKELGSIIVKAWQAMALTEKDGYGAAWISPSGRLQYVKCSTPSLQDIHVEPLPFVKGFKKLHGKLASNGGELIIHGRTATNDINLENCHPMLDGQAALIHNGVVDSEIYDLTQTSCDSEYLMRAWNDQGLESVAANISGYYAFAHLQADAKGGALLSVVRDSKAQLRVGKLLGQGVAFATTDTLLKIAGSEVIGDFKDNTFAQFQKGKYLFQKTFEPYVAPYSAAREAAAARALGLDYESDYYGRYNAYSKAETPLGIDTSPQELLFD